MIIGLFGSFQGIDQIYLNLYLNSNHSILDVKIQKNFSNRLHGIKYRLQF